MGRHIEAALASVRTYGHGRKLFPVNYEAGLVIGLPGEQYDVDWFIHRSLTLTDVKLCLFIVCHPFVYTVPLFIALLMFPKK